MLRSNFLNEKGHLIHLNNINLVTWEHQNQQRLFCLCCRFWCSILLWEIVTYSMHFYFKINKFVVLVWLELPLKTNKNIFLHNSTTSNNHKLLAKLVYTNGPWACSHFYLFICNHLPTHCSQKVIRHLLKWKKQKKISLKISIHHNDCP